MTAANPGFGSHIAVRERLSGHGSSVLFAGREFVFILTRRACAFFAQMPHSCCVRLVVYFRISKPSAGRRMLFVELELDLFFL
jgi:hypothetical protein